MVPLTISDLHIKKNLIERIKKSELEISLMDEQHQFPKRIYLDTCSMNRPFDDLSQDRIRLEVDAIIAILKIIESGKTILVSSEANEIEIKRMPDLDRKNKVKTTFTMSHDHVRIDEAIRARAKNLASSGIYGYDALHIACAEAAHVDIFFTTDDDLVKKYDNVHSNSEMLVINPLEWISKVI